MIILQNEQAKMCFLPCRLSRQIGAQPVLLSSGHVPVPSSTWLVSLHSSAEPETSDVHEPSLIYKTKQNNLVSNTNIMNIVYHVVVIEHIYEYLSQADGLAELLERCLVISSTSIWLLHHLINRLNC